MKLETVTGKLIDINDPDPGQIDIQDIAWGLSRISRFCGHTITEVPYNVAQHSVFVANEVEEWCRANLKEGPYSSILLHALLHDAAEVYTGDWPSPIKQIPELRPIIKRIENNLMVAINEAFDLVPMTDEEGRIIKLADDVAKKIEAHAFMPSRGANWPNMPDVSLEKLQKFESPLASLASYRTFMERFEYYTKDYNATRTEK